MGVAMTKPWEEDWAYLQQGYAGEEVERVVTPGNSAHFGWVDGAGGTYGESSDKADAGRAKLAAQAPAMARLLLEVQWSAGDDGGYCPVCGGVEKHIYARAGHMDHCEFALVLRAAGVLP